MGTIVSYIAHFLGFLMDFFFKGLTLIGYPRLWACIVLFAVVTRFLFLPQKINGHRSKLLMPVVNRELLAADPKFFEKTNDRELTIERAALKREVFKKYKISNGSGCLTSILQFPLLAALFYVVKNPQEFIPSLEALSSASPEVNSLFGVSLAAIPLKSFMDAGTGALILLVPALVMFCNVAKMFSSLRLAKTTSQKVKVYGLCAFFTLLTGWFSASLPLAISLYWIANDITLYIFDLFIHKYLPKNKSIAAVLDDYREARTKEMEEKSVSSEPESAISEDGSLDSSDSQKDQQQVVITTA